MVRHQLPCQFSLPWARPIQVYAVGLPVTLHNGVDNGRYGWIQIGGIQARDNTYYGTVLVLSWGDKKNDSAGIAGRTDG